MGMILKNIAAGKVVTKFVELPTLVGAMKQKYKLTNN